MEEREELLKAIELINKISSRENAFKELNESVTAQLKEEHEKRDKKYFGVSSAFEKAQEQEGVAPIAKPNENDFQTPTEKFIDRLIEDTINRRP